MIIYYIYLIFLFLLSINSHRFKKSESLKLFTLLILFLILAFRFRTGGDFAPYIRYFDNFDTIINPFSLHQFIIFISKYFGLNFFGFMVFTSFIFVMGLFFFLKNFQNFYLSLIYLFPVFIIIYGFGSIRQGIAIMIFFSIIHLKNNWTKHLGMLCAFLFHFTTVLPITLYYLSLFKLNQLNLKFLLIYLLFILSFILIFNNQMYNYINYYMIQLEYFSSGFVLRNFSTFILSIFFLFLYIKKKVFYFKDIKSFLFLSSLFCILLFPIGFFYSTVADRLMAFFYPFQLYVINLILSNYKKTNFISQNTIVFIHSFTLLIVWDLFGNNSHAWIYELFFYPNKF